MKKPVNPAITMGIPKNRKENQWDETKKDSIELYYDGVFRIHFQGCFPHLFVKKL